MDAPPQFVTEIDIPLTTDGRVSFGAALYELVRRVCEVDLPEGEVLRQVERLYKRLLKGVDMSKEDHNNFSAFVIVKRVQKRWRHLCRAHNLVDRHAVRSLRAGVPSAQLVVVRPARVLGLQLGDSDTSLSHAGPARH